MPRQVFFSFGSLSIHTLYSFECFSPIFVASPIDSVGVLFCLLTSPDEPCDTGVSFIMMQYEIMCRARVYIHVQHESQTFSPASWGHAYGLVRSCEAPPKKVVQVVNNTMTLGSR
ncbi:hypothetical protein BGW80DRAFT_1335222 [Lactifluus volemus]|nr:hypothetical protein BGW80DRAFT_1335222 [Lactifluus volemus]